MSAVATQMSLDQYLQSARETADPKALLDLVLAENERSKSKFEAREHEYRIAAECELDDEFRPRPKNLAQVFRLARVYVDAGLAPKAYLDAPNPVSAVAIGILYALRCGVEIPMFLQNSYPVNGKIGIESKLAIALLIKSGKVVGRPHYSLKYEGGKAVACTCTVIDQESGEEKTQTVTWEMVTKEGWDRNKGTQVSKWTTLPELMFQYRAGVFVMRVHYPDVLMGMYTTEEFEDMQRADAGPAMSMQELSDRLVGPPAEDSPKPAPAKPRGRRGADPAPEKPPVATKKAPPEKIHDPEIEDQDPFNPEDEKTPVEAKPVESKKPATQKPVEEKPVTPASVRQNSPEIPNIVAYMESMHGEKCNGFDLEKIAGDAKTAPNWSMFCKSVIDKSRPGWETYVLDENQESDDEPGQQEDFVEGEEEFQADQNQEVPDCVANPPPRPATPDPVVRSMEKTIMDYRQAKRIEDFANSKVRGNPDLMPAEEQWLLGLAGRRAYFLKTGMDYDKLPKERQISN